MRRKRKIDRESGKLADTNLIVIASEDEYAVKQYFHLFHSVRIQFEVLETENGRSPPKMYLTDCHVTKRNFKSEKGMNFG